jgi:hypothetical protein
MKKHVLMALVSAFSMSVFAQTGNRPTFVLLGSKEPTFAIPFQDDGKQPVQNTILIRTESGTAKKVRVYLVTVSSDDGGSIPLSSVDVAPGKIGQLSDTAIQKIVIVPKPLMFQKQGAYKAVLRIEASGFASADIVVVLRRAEAILETTPATIGLKLTRAFPSSFPSSEWYDRQFRTWTVNIRETGGTMGLNVLNLDADPLAEADKNIVVQGKLEFEPLQQLEPNGNVPITFTVRGITRAGDFTSNIRIRSPQLKHPFVIPVKIVVSDFVLYPLLAIVIGVYLSYYLKKIVGKKDQLVLERAIDLLQGEIQADDQLPNDKKKNLFKELDEAATCLRLNDINQADAKFKEVEKKYHAQKVSLTTKSIEFGGHGEGAVMARVSRTRQKQEDASELGCLTEPESWEIGKIIRFAVSAHKSDDQTEYSWNFGDGSKTVKRIGARGLKAHHKYDIAGSFKVTMTIESHENGRHEELTLPIAINGSMVDILTKQIAAVDRQISLFTIVLASLTGILALYFTGRPFGSLADYLGAFIWGFGLDAGVKGLSAVRTKLGLIQ